MGPGDAEDWDEGEVADEEDSSLGELWPECLALLEGGEYEGLFIQAPQIKKES